MTLEKTSDGPAVLITVRRALTRDGAVWVADGPDGHASLLARLSEAAALMDGEAYFLRTREYVSGRWVLR